jgi:hypothetical protein
MLTLKTTCTADQCYQYIQIRPDEIELGEHFIISIVQHTCAETQVTITTKEIGTLRYLY